MSNNSELALGEAYNKNPEDAAKMVALMANQIYLATNLDQIETILRSLSELCATVEPPKDGSFRVSICDGGYVELSALEDGILSKAFGQECNSTSYKLPCGNRIPCKVYEENKCLCRRR